MLGSRERQLGKRGENGSFSFRGRRPFFLMTVVYRSTGQKNLEMKVGKRRCCDLKSFEKAFLVSYLQGMNLEA